MVKRKLKIPILISRKQILVTGYFTDDDKDKSDIAIYYDDFEEGDEVIERSIGIEIDVDEIFRQNEIAGKLNLNREGPEESFFSFEEGRI